MLEKIIAIIKLFNSEGVPLPYAKDSTTNQPSVTLWFMYIANSVAISSIIYLLTTPNKTTAVIIACLYSVIQTVLYIMKKINKFKADLDDQSVELESEDEPKKDA